MLALDAKFNILEEATKLRSSYSLLGGVEVDQARTGDCRDHTQGVPPLLVVDKVALPSGGPVIQVKVSLTHSVLVDIDKENAIQIHRV